MFDVSRFFGKGDKNTLLLKNGLNFSHNGPYTNYPLLILKGENDLSLKVLKAFSDEHFPSLEQKLPDAKIFYRADSSKFTSVNR